MQANQGEPLLTYIGEKVNHKLLTSATINSAAIGQTQTRVYRLIPLA